MSNKSVFEFQIYTYETYENFGPVNFPPNRDGFTMGHEEITLRSLLKPC